jgi:predicted Zn-dependent peptidase
MVLKHTTGKLKNNMKYLLIRNKCISSVTVMFGIKVGSKNEIKKHRGISHFIEHLLFKGTKKRLTSKNISNTLYEHGANFNASTGYEVTNYYVTIDSDYIMNAIDVLSDMLFHSMLDRKEIEKEKKVVISEHKRDRSDPSSKLQSILGRLLYKNTNYSYDICGIDEDIKNITRSMIINYLLYFYKPSNIIVAVSGNYKYTNNKLVSILNEYFGKRMNHYGKITKSIKYSTKLYNNFYKNQKDFQYIHKKELYSQAFLSIAFPCYDGKSRHIYGLDIISNILGGNMSSRLFIKLREEKGLIYNVSASYNEYSDVGSFIISCSTFGDEVSILKCINIIMDEIADLRENVVSSKELNRAKNYINGDILLYLDDSSNLVDKCLDDLLLYKKVKTYNEYKKNINLQSGKIIKNLANDVFKKKKCNIGILSKQHISKKKIYDLISKYMI